MDLMHLTQHRLAGKQLFFVFILFSYKRYVKLHSAGYLALSMSIYIQFPSLSMFSRCKVYIRLLYALSSIGIPFLGTKYHPSSVTSFPNFTKGSRECIRWYDA